MEGQRHAPRIDRTNKLTFPAANEHAKMAAGVDGSTDALRRAPGRRCDWPAGMAGPVAGAEGGAAMRPPSAQPRKIDSKTLMDGARTILIEHEGQEYTLRLTRLGKLLLTK